MQRIMSQRASQDRRVALAGLVALAIATLTIAGCGEDGDEQAATTAPDGQAATTAPEEREPPSEAGSSGDSGGGSQSQGGSGGRSQSQGGSGGDATSPPVERIGRPPTTKGGDNSIQRFGDEAGAEETDAIVAALSGFLAAQADGDWARACTLASSALTEGLAQLQEGGEDPPSCEDLLAATSGQVPRAERQRQARVRLGSVRVEGDRAFAIYKGTRKAWLAMPLTREDGRWKVGSLAATPLPV